MPLASTLLPAWTARKVSRRFITPPHNPHTSREHLLLKQGQRFMVPAPMGALMAWRFGNPNQPVIIMSHGWGGRGAQFREFVAPFTETGYQVWLFDHIGHGLSSGQEAPITDFARGVVAVVTAAETAGLPIVALIGHSLGCAGIGIALRHSLRHLQQVRVVQIAPPASMIRYSHYFARALGIPERIRAAMQWRLEQKIGMKWQELEMPRAAESQTAKALIIHDHDDHDVRIENGLAVARAWPDARFHATRGLGHTRILRNPEVIQSSLGFITKQLTFPLPPQGEEHRPYLQPAPLY
ncbi:MAG: alpha/beta fold hydrolase [Betaproteobacteria bacterium]|nr:alpha/beta fold hydrolase [Betaproteobacteria bacterium]